MVVNEFGVFRWAPNADCFMRYKFELLERAGLNHAVWLWETSSPLVPYDQFNFRRGPNPKNKEYCVTSGLIEAIKANWRLNTVRLKNVRDKLPVVSSLHGFRALHRDAGPEYVSEVGISTPSGNTIR